MSKTMMIYPDDYINKVICGDCLEVMKEMPDGCVDMVITDPPYGFNRFATDQFNKLKLREIMFELKRILKDGCYAFIFSGTGLVVQLANLIPLNFQRLLWIYKPNDCTFPFQGWLLTSEAILAGDRCSHSVYTSKEPVWGLNQ